MKCKTIFSRGFSLFCLLGFLVQVQQVSELYLRFQTTSRTSFHIQETYSYQSIMYCPAIFQLFDGNKKKDFGIPNQPLLPFDQYLRFLSNLTIKDILELTPLESEVIENCMVRLGKMSTPTVMDNSKCKLYFNVTKSVYGEKICYTFIPRFGANGFSAGDVATSFSHTGSVYRIRLRPSMSNSSFASFISVANANVKDFLHSRLFQANLAKGLTLKRSRILVFGDSIEIKRLPPPYETGCTPGHDREACYEGCLVEKLKVINRLPWSGFHTEKLSMKMLTPAQLLNETILKYAGQSFEECHSLCKLKTECFTQFSKTTVIEHGAAYFYFLSALPSQPHMSVFSIPTLTLVEYIVQVGSCFGMWFGMSIISLNPLKWKITQGKDVTTGTLATHRRRLFKPKISIQPAE